MPITYKSIGPDEIESFIIKGCSKILLPFRNTTTYLVSVYQNGFPPQWKELAIVPVFKKGKSALMTTYRHISI
jgi:hypothetical protein